MRYKPDHKEQSRERILKAVGQGFRAHGFGGSGVDGLAKEAGVTSGAFYAHFSSKQDAFREAVVSGLTELRDGIVALHEKHGDRWVTAFAKFYLTERRTCPTGESCALPSLSAEVERQPTETRGAYSVALKAVLDAAAERLPGRSPKVRQQLACALLSLLSGGVTMARAVDDAALSQRIADSIITQAQALVQPS